MSKQSAKEALEQLSREVDAEISRHQREDGPQANQDLAGLFMSNETFNILAQQDYIQIRNHHIRGGTYSFYEEAYGTPTTIACMFTAGVFSAHIMIDNRLQLGKVKIRHFPPVNKGTPIY